MIIPRKTTCRGSARTKNNRLPSTRQVALVTAHFPLRNSVTRPADSSSRFQNLPFLKNSLCVRLSFLIEHIRQIPVVLIRLRRRHCHERKP